MAELWPSTLPQCFLAETISWQLGDGRLRTPMESGPAKGRPRSSAVSDVLRGDMKMTRAQWRDLILFYKTTVRRTDTFIFPDPDDAASGGDILVRFGDGVPGAVAVGRGNYAVSIELEVLPQ